MPEDARCAGLTLIGWLARRMPGEDSSKDGVDHARRQLEEQLGGQLEEQLEDCRALKNARRASTTISTASVTATNGMRRAHAFVETTRVSRQVVVRLETRDSDEAPSAEAVDGSRPSV